MTERTNNEKTSAFAAAVSLFAAGSPPFYISISGRARLVCVWFIALGLLLALAGNLACQFIV